MVRHFPVGTQSPTISLVTLQMKTTPVNVNRPWISYRHREKISVGLHRNIKLRLRFRSEACGGLLPHFSYRHKSIELSLTSQPQDEATGSPRKQSHADRDVPGVQRCIKQKQRTPALQPLLRYQAEFLHNAAPNQDISQHLSPRGAIAPIVHFSNLRRS